MKLPIGWALAGVLALGAGVGAASADEKPLKVLLIDGQNNHKWQETTPVVKKILEGSGRFQVEVSTTPPSPPRQPQPPKGALTDAQKAAHEKALADWKAAKDDLAKKSAEQWSQWRPDFTKYDVVVSNYNGEEWPVDVKTAFAAYIRRGGGLTTVHAADNSFSQWPEYNEMIGVGGWGGRNEKWGPMIRWRDGKIVRDETPGPGGAHSGGEYVIDLRDAEHPIVKGLPARWKHGPDELYEKLRGPAKNLSVLATAWSDPAKKGTGENEPLLMTITYEQGRIFHTALGHDVKAMESVGFQTTLARGTEWAATGKVTLPAPAAEKLPLDQVGREPSVTAAK